MENPSKLANLFNHIWWFSSLWDFCFWRFFFKSIQIEKLKKQARLIKQRDWLNILHTHCSVRVAVRLKERLYSLTCGWRGNSSVKSLMRFGEQASRKPKWGSFWFIRGEEDVSPSPCLFTMLSTNECVALNKTRPRWPRSQGSSLYPGIHFSHTRSCYGFPRAIVTGLWGAPKATRCQQLPQ